jgi:hypothetical protein
MRVNGLNLKWMKHALIIFSFLILISSCKKEGNASQSIVGDWTWVSSYNAGFEIGVININKGTFHFDANMHWTRRLNQILVDSGTYTLFASSIMQQDSIHFNRTLPPPSYPILDSTYAYYSIQGKSLSMGALNNPNSPIIWLYGIVDIYQKNSHNP